MTTPNDPFFNQQWHLLNGTPLNRTPGEFDLNVVGVWDDYTGDGVEVAIIDDAFERNHADLNANYSNYKDWDFEDNDTDASPSQNGRGKDGKPADSHGTAVAGIIGAVEGNRLGGVGVAYDSTLFGFKVHSFDHITAAINNASGKLETNGRNREADVVNISMGTDLEVEDDEENLVSSHYFARDFSELNIAIDDSVRQGRNGLGTVIVKSAGNDRGGHLNADTNASSWNANPHTISVAGVDKDGSVSSYSTHGASILVSGFGTPRDVVTTDRTGAEGDSTTDETYFNGTSAAAPMVSGVVALMLEANPLLGWRDVQNILAYSARHVGSSMLSGPSGDEEYNWRFNGANDWNGGGLHFSNDYGFGLVDAKAAVRLAETWFITGEAANTSQNKSSPSADFLDFRHTVNRENDGGSSFTKSISRNIKIEHVEVDIRFTQWHDLGDLKIELISPQLTTSILIDKSGENDETSSGGFGSGRWKFSSNAFRGEQTIDEIRGSEWKIKLFDADNTASSPITIDDIQVTFTGEAVSNDDRFIFTDEYDKYVGGLNTRSQAFNGGAGTDTINAAAVDSDSIVDLSQGTGKIDGKDITVSGIEHVITGDGDDRLLGNNANNILYGGKGRDHLRGYDGNDRMYGGDGSDFYFRENAGDIIVERDDDSGVDTIYTYLNYNADAGRPQLEANVERLLLGGTATHATGNGLNNTITANASNRDSLLYGEGGNDTLIGRAGNDFLHGGEGNGNDIMLGGAGNDIMRGYGGNDKMYGGTDDDMYFVHTVGDQVIENANEGIDTIYTYLNYNSAGRGQLEANVENLELGGTATYATGNELNNEITANASGRDSFLYGLDGDDKLLGRSEASRTGNETMYGGAGNDFLRGYYGNDKMYGGTDNDRYFVHTNGDQVFEYANQGIDTIYTYLNYNASGRGRLEANVENLELGGTATYATGNALNNTITANASNRDSFLYGERGNDTLLGKAGDDSLYGGEGSDTLRGGAGDDYLRDGGSGRNYLYGEADNDTFYGGGDNYFYGGTGDDIYYVGSNTDRVIENSGEGTDTVRTYHINYTLTDNVEHLELQAGSVTRGTGNSLDNRIIGNSNDNTLRGGAGDDYLRGLGGKDYLYGEADNDTFYGDGGGEYYFYGGTGDDIYYVGSNTDRVIENSGEGTDTVRTYHINYTLTDNVENLIFEEGRVIRGTGNDLDNLIQGNSNNNSLNGQGGNDLLVGGNGNDRLNGFGTIASPIPQFDRLRGGTGSDTFILGGNWGVSYFEEGDGYAVIEDWDSGSDSIEVRHASALGGGFYSLNETVVSGIGSNATDMEIYFTNAVGQRDRIAIIQDRINVNINQDFSFV